ncbi:MAG: chromate reductase [Saprospiraceae bacterium]
MSSNTQLLEAIYQHFGLEGSVYKGLLDLPIFVPGLDHHPLPAAVFNWRNTVLKADAIIISTPVYIFNIPAVLKNALEWLTTSGEMDRKAVLPITYTPYAPRGEKAMQSLLWSLTALNAQVITQLPLYKTELAINTFGKLEGAESIELIAAAIHLLGHK